MTLTARRLTQRDRTMRTFRPQPTTIIRAVAGDGLLQLPEQCDDFNVVGGDGCSATMQIERTGP